MTIKETKAPAGYLPDPEAHEITVTADMAAANRLFSNTRWPTSSLSRSSEAT
ncbi:MAG: prealbumin-like fold domain-containing protein [Adlercreutzia equolifaciens]